MSTTPTKNEGGDVDDLSAAAIKSSPSKSTTPLKVVPEVTQGSSPAKDSSNLLGPNDLTVDTGPTPPITPESNRDGTNDKSAESPKVTDESPSQPLAASPDKQKPSSDSQVSDGNTPGSDSKKIGKERKRTPNKKSPPKSPKSPRSPKDVVKENQDPVKEGDETTKTKLEPRGSEGSEKPADATSTTSTGGVQTSGSEDVTGKVPGKKPRERGNRNRGPRKPREPRNDGGMERTPWHDNLGEVKNAAGDEEIKEGDAGAVEGGESGNKSDKNQSPRDQRGPRQRGRGRGYGYRGGARPGFFPAKKTQPRVVNTVKSGDESAPEGEKKVTTSEGGPTEGSGTETDKPAAVQRRRNRNKNRPRRRKSGSRNREEGDKDGDGGQSDTQNGYSSDRDKTEVGGEGVKQVTNQRRRRGPPRGPPRERRDSDPEKDGDNQQPRDGQRQGFRGRGFNQLPRGYFGRGRGGSWNNDNRFNDRRNDGERRVDDRRNDDRRNDDRSETNTFRDNHFNRDRNNDDHRPVGGYQRRENNFNRDNDSRSSYPGGVGYPARSYGNSNFGRGGAAFEGGNRGSTFGGPGGNQGFRGRGGFRGGYSENRSGGGSGFNARGGSGRQWGDNNRRWNDDRTSRNHDGVTPIDVKGLPGQGPSVSNTHQGGFWNP